MTTIIERRDSASADSSAMTMIVAIVALAVIVGLVLYALGAYPFTRTDGGSTAGGGINVSVDGGTE